MTSKTTNKFSPTAQRAVEWKIARRLAAMIASRHVREVHGPGVLE
jgi:hypothetical protein